MILPPLVFPGHSDEKILCGAHTGACTIKPFMVVTVAVLYQARVFATAIHFNHSPIFAGNARCLLIEWSSMRATYFYEKSSCLLV